MVIELPVCQWRRQPTAPGFHVCISPRVRCNADGIPDRQCDTCLHRNHAPAPTPRRQCMHFGDLVHVRPLRLLNRDDGYAIAARVHHCAVHGECTPITANVRLQNCLTCPDHADDWRRPAAGSVRHLTYFLFPAGPYWRWNVDQLRARLSLFNGKRLVAVAVGGDSASFAEVVEAFAGDQVELQELVNDPGRREMVGHMQLIRAMSAYRGNGDVTFYAHGKGASSYHYGEPVRRWAAAMYSGLLDYWPAVKRQLVDHAAVGVFRRILTAPSSLLGGWHFSGTFRWLRNKDLYCRNWQVEDAWWMGSELYPGRHFRLDESACLYGEFAYGGVGLYGADTWEAWAQAARDDFEAAHVADREAPMLVTVVLTAHAQPKRVHEAIASVQNQTRDAWQLVVMYSGRIDAVDLVERYRTDGRIRLEPTGEDEQGSTDRCGQGWAINEAWRRGLVAGDLVVYLSDDDVLYPDAVAQWILTAAGAPGQSAWYAMAERQRIDQAGGVELLGPLGLRGIGGPSNSLRRHVDGLQVCHRRAAQVEWPQDRAVAGEADGVWMEALQQLTPIHPAQFVVGIHRHTPESCFTQ
jgi:hypothetical protein